MSGYVGAHRVLALLSQAVTEPMACRRVFQDAGCRMRQIGLYLIEVGIKARVGILENLVADHCSLKGKTALREKCINRNAL